MSNLSSLTLCCLLTHSIIFPKERVACTALLHLQRINFPFLLKPPSSNVVNLPFFSCPFPPASCLVLRKFLVSPSYSRGRHFVGNQSFYYAARTLGIIICSGSVRLLGVPKVTFWTHRNPGLAPLCGQLTPSPTAVMKLTCVRRC